MEFFVLTREPASLYVHTCVGKYMNLWQGHNLVVNIRGAVVCKFAPWQPLAVDKCHANTDTHKHTHRHAHSHIHTHMQLLISSSLILEFSYKSLNSARCGSRLKPIKYLKSCDTHTHTHQAAAFVCFYTHTLTHMYIHT